MIGSPLPQAHAHGDGEHPRPLLDALERGFASVEADVHVVGGQVLVAHDPEDVDPARTLRALYLEPLRELTQQLPDHFRLLIDVKTPAVVSWLVVEAELARFDQLVTSFVLTADGYVATPRAVTVVISGFRPVDLMARTPVRRSAYDGRVGDLCNGSGPEFMPLVSENWTNLFSWNGDGEMPDHEQARLAEFVAVAHEAGRQVRFWNTPDAPGPQRTAVWTTLLDAGVDVLNTDDLDGLRAFLLARSRGQRSPAVDLLRAETPS